jgi:hypothetical protein
MKNFTLVILAILSLLTPALAFAMGTIADTQGASTFQQTGAYGGDGS